MGRTCLEHAKDVVGTHQGHAKDKVWEDKHAKDTLRAQLRPSEGVGGRNQG